MLPKHQLAVVLAALRNFQSTTKQEDRTKEKWPQLEDREPPSDNEIDVLCEKLNTGGDKVRVVLEVHGGVMTDVWADCEGVEYALLDYDILECDGEVLAEGANRSDDDFEAVPVENLRERFEAYREEARSRL